MRGGDYSFLRAFVGRLFWFTVIICFFLSIPENILAADPVLNVPGSRQQPGISRPELPEFSPPTSGEEPILPPVKLWEEKEPMLSTIPRVMVNEIRIIGNSIFPEEELAAITAPYENRVITNNELQELRLRLTRYYIDKGYINSGAVIPDQKVTDGVITIRIIEGHLSDVRISGNSWLRTPYIQKRLLWADSGSPLNIDDLQQKLQLLDRNPLLKRVNGELGPGLVPGEAILRVQVEEARPYQFNLRIANDRSPSSGELRAEARAVHRNVSGWGDSLGVRYGLTEGTDDYSVYYSIPLTSRDLSLTLAYSKNDSNVIEEPFDLIDIESESETIEVALRYPIIKTLTREFAISLSGQYRSSKTWLLGQPFSFSPGVVDGECKVSVLRLSVDWTERSQQQVLAIRSVFSNGIDAFDATINSGEPDSEFFTWLGQVQWARRINLIPDSQLIFRTDVQLTDRSLLPLEKFAVGGANSVRGYRENQMVRDNGLVSSLEYRIPLFRLPLPLISKGAEDGTLQLALFGDWGRSWNKDYPTPDPETIGSYGAGLRWLISSRMNASIYYGKATEDFINPDENSLQDDGIHFQFNWQVL